MAENEKVSAKELYRWKKGFDDFDIEILSALNDIISGLNTLQCDNWQYIVNTMNSSTSTIAEHCDKLFDGNELMEITEKFELIRTLLFGDKINYTNLLTVLEENVNECGYTKETAKKKRAEYEAQEKGK